MTFEVTGICQKQVYTDEEQQIYFTWPYNYKQWFSWFTRFHLDK